MESDSKSCLLCCEDFRGQLHKKIECIHCSTSTCLKCLKYFLLNDTRDAHCYKCKKHWNREFLINNISYSFVEGEYMKHRENILFNFQMSLMEETQAVIERENLLREMKCEVTLIDKKIKELFDKKSEINLKIQDIKNNPDEHVKFNGHCPRKDCRGFINSNWICGICDTIVCKDCVSILEPNHKCDKNVVASLQTMKSFSKPCPNCRVPINRSEGCLQMWCTRCHTAFDWRTMKIIRSKDIHNPHFLEWKEDGGNVHNNNNYDAVENILGMTEYFYGVTTRHLRHNKYRNWLFSFMGLLSHIQHNVMPHINNYINNGYEKNNFILRKRFLMGYIDKENFKKKIQQNDKKRSKIRDIYVVYSNFITSSSVCIDGIMYSDITIPYNYVKNESEYCIYNNIVKEKNIMETWDIISNLIDCMNESFSNISKLYRNKTPHISYPDLNDEKMIFCISG